MSEQLSEAAILTLVKNKLTGERIKLWLPPYSYEDGTEAEFTLELKKRYAEELNLPIDAVLQTIDSLRCSSVERLKARNEFLLHSKAALKIKVSNAKNAQGAAKENIFVETKLDEKGIYLKQKVAEQCKVELDTVKLIACGRLITDDVSLEEQRITVTTPIMAIFVQNSASAVNSSTSIRDAREDAEILANQTVDSEDDSMMQIADQNNRPIEIPKSDRKAITLAMILNERGKSAMQRKNYSEAIPLLLEADKEFQKCDAEILKLVDNYAILCMDITWCYLCLQSIEDLPDAEKRITTCEEYLKKCYGENMERLISIKGTTGGEAVLFVRLKLLKGIAAFHRRLWKVAESCFLEVERELKRLIVDDEKLSQMLSMGYLTAEARLALRSCSGDVQMAISFLINRAKEREELKKIERKKNELKKLSRVLGKTVNDQWVNAEFYNNLISMGYSASTALAALKQSNNNVPLAVQILQEHPDLLKVVDAKHSDYLLTDEVLEKVKECGFSQEASKRCLMKHKGNVQAAIEELITTGGIFLEEVNTATGGPSTSDAKISSPDEQFLWTLQNEAFGRLQSDIFSSNYDDSHLDFTLEEESKFLNEYLQLLRYAKQ